MSDSPVVEITALDAKALRELVDGLMAEVRLLRSDVERLKWPAVVPTVWTSEGVGVGRGNCSCPPNSACSSVICPRARSWNVSSTGGVAN